MAFAPLSDDQWEKASRIISAKLSHGRPRANDRRTLNAILFVVEGGVPWNYLPKEFGDDSTANRRYKEWRSYGIWDLIVEAIGVKSQVGPLTSLQPYQSSTLPV